MILKTLGLMISRGEVLLCLGRYEHALQALNRALELNPDYGMAFSNKGTALYYLRKYEEAVQAFSEALKLDPEDIFSYAWRGDTYGKLGKHKRSEEDYLEGIKKGDSLAPLDAENLSMVGWSHYRLDQYDQAIRTYLELCPSTQNAVSPVRSGDSPLVQWTQQPSAKRISKGYKSLL